MIGSNKMPTARSLVSEGGEQLLRQCAADSRVRSRTCWGNFPHLRSPDRGCAILVHIEDVMKADSAESKPDDVQLCWVIEARLHHAVSWELGDGL